MLSRSDLTSAVKAEALSLGFCLAGVTGPETPPHFPEYQAWLEHGRNAGMAYLASDWHVHSRQNPASLLPGVISILCLALPYPNPDLAGASPGKAYGRVSAYAWGRDYHDVLAEKTNLLAGGINRLAGREVQWKAFTDSGPLMEKDLASRAGLGWIGRNSLLINPEMGSHFFLTELLLNLELEIDAAFTADRCGTCQKCIDVCPTHAILENRTLDAGRCISCLTIEDKLDAPGKPGAGVGEWIFGCDICQLVCPWNAASAGPAADMALTARQSDAYIYMPDELGLDEPAFRVKYAGRGILRVKRGGHLRNVLAVMGSQPAPWAANILANFLREERDPHLRRLAVQALANTGS